jgi:anti-sigma regulatory factor (Ser/Thr protein kinase)
VTAEGGQSEARPGGSALEPGGFTPLDQAFDSGSLYALRAAVAAHAAAAGLGRDEVYDVTAVAHELAANAVVHGAGHGRLRLWTDAGFLYCQVSDDGKAGTGNGAVVTGDGESAMSSAGTVSSADTVAGGLPWPAEHGHGLWLATQLAERVGVGHGSAGTTSTVRFPLAHALPG